MSVTDQAITHYQAAWHVASNSGNITLIFNQQSQHQLVGLKADAFHAIIDVLRNERPVYWSEADQTLHTLSELVGEGEMK